MSGTPTPEAFVRRMFCSDLSGARAEWGDAELEVAWSYLLRLDARIASQPVLQRAPHARGEKLLDLLHARQPVPLDELRSLKDWARMLMNGNGRTISNVEPIPPRAASALYHLVIVLAMIWHGMRISSMDDRALSEGARWAAKQPWIDADSRAIFARWLLTSA